MNLYLNMEKRINIGHRPLWIGPLMAVCPSAWSILLRSLVAVVIVALFLAAKSAASADGSVAITDGGEEVGLLRKVMSEARKYRKLYNTAKESYDALREGYESAYAELRDIEDRIHLLRSNQGDFEAFIERDRRAWLLLYQRRDGGQSQLRPGSKSGDPGGAGWSNTVPFLPRFQPGDAPDLTGNKFSRWLERYRIYKARYQAVQAAAGELRQAAADIERRLTVARRELEEAQRASAQERIDFNVRRNAWKRLYTE